MVLSVKKAVGFVLCASTCATSETTGISALRTQSHRGLASGIHHSVKYAPTVVEQKTASDSMDSSYVVSGSKTTDLELKLHDEMEIDAVQEDVDMDITGSFDADVKLQNDEVMDIEADSDQEVDIFASNSLDTSIAGSLDPTHQLDSDIDFTQGEVEVELEDDEAYEQSLNIDDNEEFEELLDIPEGAKSIHLRMHKGYVDLDIIKNDVKKDAPHEEKKSKDEKKKKEKPLASETKEAAVSYAAETKSWIQNNTMKAPILGSLIGAAVGVLGLAVVAIAKSRKRASKKSAEDTSADDDAEAEEDAAPESDSDEDSDEDVEAGVTALTEEDAVKEEAVEEKKASVVEGSV